MNDVLGAKSSLVNRIWPLHPLLGLSLPILGSSFFFFFFFFFFVGFCLFRAGPATWGAAGTAPTPGGLWSSWARDQIRAAAVTYTTTVAMPDP